jgi:hypothetical protein
LSDVRHPIWRIKSCQAQTITSEITNRNGEQPKKGGKQVVDLIQEMLKDIGPGAKNSRELKIRVSTDTKRYTIKGASNLVEEMLSLICAGGRVVRIENMVDGSAIEGEKLRALERVVVQVSDKCFCADEAPFQCSFCQEKKYNL